MKTLLFIKGANRVAVKVDIFAKDSELQEPGFDTRFTAMEIVDEEAAIAAGLNFSEIEYRFRSLVSLAQTNGWDLIVSGVVSAAIADVQAPSIPPNLTAPTKTTTTVDLDWDDSTDNVGVVSYNVFKDGVFNKNVAVTNAQATGLVTLTPYVFAVTALDAAGNESERAILSVTTA